MLPIRTDLGGIHAARLLPFGEAFLFDAPPMAVVPLRPDLGAQPVWRDRRQRIQRGAQGLCDSLESVQRPDDGQDRGRIRARFAARFEVALLGTCRSQHVKEALFSGACDEPGAELR
jgi:hypothetical protein